MHVRGEVDGFHKSALGHCYFTLKDGAARLDCVLFAREAIVVRRVVPELGPELNGSTVTLRGGLTLYEAHGKYQLKVEEIFPEGVWGPKQQEYEALRQELEGKGLLDPSRKRALPAFPRRVGVVTSRGSEAWADIRSAARERAAWLDLIVSYSPVHGPGTGVDIAAAMERLASAQVDVVIVARGGGSPHELWGFNESPVAYAVANCAVPVVSGVGHKNTPTTICDLVADQEAATPSEAAAMVADRAAAVLATVDRLQRRLHRSLSVRTRTYAQQLDAGASRLPSAFLARVRRQRTTVVALDQRFPGVFRNRVRFESRTLTTSADRLSRALSQRSLREAARMEARTSRLPDAMRQRWRRESHRLNSVASVLPGRIKRRVRAEAARSAERVVRLPLALRRRLARQEERLEVAASRLPDALRRRLTRERERMSVAASRLPDALRYRVRHEEGRLATLAAALNARSPLSTLARGYALPISLDGLLLRRVGDFAPALAFRLRVVDGSVPCATTGTPTQDRRIGNNANTDTGGDR